MSDKECFRDKSVCFSDKSLFCKFRAELCARMKNGYKVVVTLVMRTITESEGYS